MIEYFSENLWLLWSVITLLCLIIELSSGDFFIICFAIGAVCAGLSSFLGIQFWMQVLVFAIFSVLSILFVRPSLVKFLHAKGQERASNAEALIGREGVTIEPINVSGSGYVKIDGDEWKAVTCGDSDIACGEKVKVVGMESIVITVEKL